MNPPTRELDYQTPGAEFQSPCCTPVLVAIVLLALTLIVVNSLLARMVATDRDGWMDLFVVVWIGPVADAAVAVVALLFAIVVKKLAGRRPIVLYLTAAVVLPVLSYCVLREIIAYGFLR